MKYAYVVFRDMNSKEASCREYDMSNGYRWLAYCCKCCCLQRYNLIAKKYFNNKWIKVTNSDQPDEINYQNVGYSTLNRRIRKLIIWLIAIALIIAGMIGVVYFKLKSDELKQQFNTTITCPEGTISKKDAWIDQNKLPADRVGMMHCFCMQELKKDPTKYLKTDFKEFENDQNLYCK